MSEQALRILAVVGSPAKNAVTRVVLQQAAESLRARGCVVDFLDLQAEPLPLFNPEESYKAPGYAELQRRVEGADVYLLGTPDYHGTMTGVLKNFLDHFWQEYAGKLFVPIVVSYDKGLTVADQIRTVARQVYAWSLPYAVSFVDREDVKDGVIVSDAFRKRFEMMLSDVVTYGRLLAAQRRADLEGAGAGFMARYRKAATQGT